MGSLCCGKRCGSERVFKNGIYIWALMIPRGFFQPQWFCGSPILLASHGPFPPSLTKQVMQVLGTGPAGRLIINLENEPEMKSKLILFVGFPKAIFISSQRLPQSAFQTLWLCTIARDKKMYNHFAEASVSESPFLQDLRVGLKSGWFPGKRNMKRFVPFEKKAD